MRISDWSSDVCSSDLLEQPQRPDRHIVDVPHGVAFTEQRTARPERHDRDDRFEMRELVLAKRGAEREMAYIAARSEEHTSEIQSLMRISYAVFCLKKKKQQNT